MSKESAENFNYQDPRFRFQKKEEWYGFCIDVEKSGSDKEARDRVMQLVNKERFSRIPTPEDGRRWLRIATATQGAILGEDIEKTLSKRTEIDHTKSFAFPVSKNYLQGWIVSNDLPVEQFPSVTEQSKIFLNAFSSPLHKVVIPDTQMAKTIPKKYELALSLQQYDREVFKYSLSIDYSRLHPEIILQQPVDVSNTTFMIKKDDAKIGDVLAFKQLFHDAKNFRT